MPDGPSEQTVTVLSAIHDVPAPAWDACAGAADPFVSHAFFACLEDSGAVGPEAGWLARHLVVRDAGGALLGVAPLYLKGHSYGEYVFDWGWADAYERAGGRYYPKLQAAVPFTPVPGRRLMLAPGAPEGVADGVADALAAGMAQLGDRLGASSAHVTFCTEAEWRRLGRIGYLQRTGVQFHWHNRGYGTFDAFLDDLTSRKRKAIRKERRAVADGDIRLCIRSGGDIAERHWDAFFAFYSNTHDRKWGHAYLNRRFFSLLGERLGDRVVLVLAETADGRPVAGALNLRGASALYGRYWGCLERYKFLHFEACYYQAIDYAIAHGIDRVEAGAQGPHKVQRGYLPVTTYSAHWIADERLRTAVARFLDHERVQVEREIAALAAESPFRADRDAAAPGG